MRGAPVPLEFWREPVLPVKSARRDEFCVRCDVFIELRRFLRRKGARRRDLS